MEAANPVEAETFAHYLAKYYFVHKGFNAAIPPEAAVLKQACDFVICRHNGMYFEIVCIVDREARPDARFRLAPDDTREVARNCLKYSGKIGVSRMSQMPVSIQVVEVGPGINAHEEQRRLQAFQRESPFSKAMVFAWLLDTSSATVWTNGPPGVRYFTRFSTFQRLLRKPRVDITNIHDIEARPSADSAVASSDVAYVTYVLLAVLAAVFATECVFALGPLKGLLQPSLATLEALGGLHWPRVVESDEWYRLLSATFLHADLLHLSLNAFVLFYAGRRLEWIIGHSWFAATYFISAVCGSLFSLALNPVNLVGIGASGAIMGILAASVVCSFHFAVGATRTQLQMTALQVLIPSLLPVWLTTRSGMLVDLGAHIGGAIGGALVGAILLAIWPRSSPMPRLRYLALALAGVGILGSLASLIPITRSYAAFQHEEELLARLIPANLYPATVAAGRSQADSLVTRYPDDPRGYLFRGMNALQANNYTRAVADFRTGLEKNKEFATVLPPAVEELLRANLALAQAALGNISDAKTTAQPVCRKDPSDPLRRALGGLCN